MNRRAGLGGLLAGLIAAVVVATALAQVPPSTEPAAADEDAGTTGAAQDVAAAEPDAGAEPADAAGDALVAADGASPGTATATGSDAAAGPSTTEDGRSRVVQRRREAALVGGWVASVRDPASGKLSVDDLVLGANGEWLRRASTVDPAAGLVGAPEESSGTWFTEEGTLVLLARGSAVDEVLRAAYQIDDRSEKLVLETSGGPATYDRYR